MIQDDDIASRLAVLEEKIALKQRDLQQHGVLHGDVRLQAVELQSKIDSFKRSMQASGSGQSGARWKTTLTAEFGSLSSLFERWVAGVDRGH